MIKLKINKVKELKSSGFVATSNVDFLVSKINNYWSDLVKFGGRLGINIFSIHKSEYTYFSIRNFL